ncbi:hypothetical protein [Sphingobacterium multivorum]|uniref:hypothetical protein n=1 Tax=Sphingobacterium multivorum TaxID=28454 RepID=UPI003DA3B201
MNKLIFIPLLLLALGTQNSPKPKETINRVVDSSIVDKPVKYDVSVSLPDKLTIKSDNNKEEENWTKNMPWIGAIIIGFLTVGGNVLISKQSRKSNSAIAEKQIEQLRINSERDFNKTVLSSSRQLWVNDLRSLISELLTLASVFSIKQQMEPDNLHKLYFLVTKAELMLSNNSDHLPLTQQLLNLKNCCSDIMMQKKGFDVLEYEIETIKTETVLVLQKEIEKASRGA